MERAEQLRQWLSAALGSADFRVAPASDDASFRRYFRISRGGAQPSLIAMDAPPANEDCRQFVFVANLFASAGVHVPAIHAQDLERGFLLLSDLGSTTYLEALDDDTAGGLYGKALDALILIQRASRPGVLPEYDKALLERELRLFPDWYVARQLRRELSDQQREILESSFVLLLGNNLAQPRVFVHRDYHSRNLMVTHLNNPGILDFQDAVLGPVTYDLVSLLRDCYISWPRERVEDWVKGYHELALQSGIPAGEDDAGFLRWFDLMGVQRHLKASGIFARLNHRDGKSGYLADIPRTLGYVREVSARYPELQPLQALLRELKLPGAA